MMKTETPLFLELDERNLAHFLAAIALSALADRIEGGSQQCRTCWWTDDRLFAIQSEYSGAEFRYRLFLQAFDFLKSMRWHPGLGSAAHGILVSGNELGVNPFVALNGDADASTPLKGFSGRVLPAPTVRQQIDRLQSPRDCGDWLNQRDRGVSSWRFDCRVNAHASDAGISSDAENTSEYDPFYPAIELLSLAAAAFFVPCHAWQATKNSLAASAWTRPIPLSMASLAANGRIHDLAARSYAFTWRGAAHGEGKRYHFFPPATLLNQ